MLGHISYEIIHLSLTRRFFNGRRFMAFSKMSGN
jgi:hypothetical protein